jgi:transposase
MKTARRRLDVDVEELDRVIDAAENGPLSKADRQKLKTTLHALVERLAQRRNTEKTNSVPGPENSSSAATESPEPEPPAPAGHGRNAASAFTGAETVSVQHTQLKPGDPCPECHEGRVYRQKEPKTLIRIVGQAPVKATVFEMERLRCNACCQMFTAEEPASVGANKYDATAVAMIALLKYGTGVPFNRMERLETQLGIPLPAATQWELMEPAAHSLEPIPGELIRQAAQGAWFTTMTRACGY